MKCQKCNHNEATTHFKKIVNGAKTEYHLCSECANNSEEIQNEFNSAFESDFGFGNFFKNMSNDFQIPTLLGSAFFGSPGIASNPLGIPQNIKCDICGTTFEEFSKTNLMGCPNCYSIFGNRLLNPLKQFHGNTEHIGKIPASHEAEIGLNRRIKQLEAELNQDIANQNFEHAAILRDEIKKLKEQL